MIYDVKFIGLTPVENTGQVSWEGDPAGAWDAFMEYLNGMYGPNNYKVIEFKQTEDTDPEHEPFDLPATAPTSRMIN